MIFDEGFQEVKRVVRADSLEHAFVEACLKVGDEQVVDGVRYVLGFVTAHTVPSLFNGKELYVVKGTYSRAEHRHPRLWGVTHV
jgi:hypothetical protein